MGELTGRPVELLKVLAAPLAGIAAAVAGLSALAFVFGWRYLASYYAQGGGKWVVNTYSPISTMQSIPLVAILLVAMIVFGVWQTSEGRLTKKAQKAMYLIDVIGAGLFLSVWGALVWVGFARVGQIFLLLGLGMIFFLVMTTLVHILHLIAEDSAETRMTRVFAFWMLFALLAFMGSDYVGERAGKIDFDARASRLPIAVLREEVSKKPRWRLVRASPERAILVDLTRQEQLRIFRIVPVEAIVAVVEVKPVAK